MSSNIEMENIEKSW